MAKVLTATAVNKTTGEKKYLVDGKLQDKPRSHSSSKSSGAVAKLRKAQEELAKQSQAKVTITNPETQVTTTQEFNNQGQQLKKTTTVEQPTRLTINQVQNPNLEKVINKVRENRTGVFIQDKNNFQDKNKTKIGNFVDKKFSEIKTKAENYSFESKKEQQKINPSYIKATGYQLGALGLGAVVASKEQIIDPLRNPIDTITNTAKGIYSLATSKEARQEFQTSTAEFGSRVKEGDPISTSQLLVAVASPKVSGVVNQGIIKGVAKGVKEVQFINKIEKPINEFVSPQSKFTQFPKAKGTQDIINKLKEADNKVITFSPQRLGRVDKATLAPTSNIFKGERISGDTRKGALGLEDGGINVAPKGEGNPYFLRLQETKETRYTLNPKKILESIKQEFQTPTITEFQTKGAVRPPREVLLKPGFEAVKKFQIEEVAGTGKVVLTKRSIIGQGEIKSQSFRNIKNKNKLTKEAGTTEFEFAIPQTQKYQDKGIIGFTRVNNQKVAIRKGELIVDKKLSINNKLDDLSDINKKTNINNKSYSSYDNVRYKSPIRYNPSAINILSKIKTNSNKSSFSKNNSSFAISGGVSSGGSSSGGSSGGVSSGGSFGGGSSEGRSSGSGSSGVSSGSGSSGGGSSGVSSGSGSSSGSSSGVSLNAINPKQKPTIAYDVYVKEGTGKNSKYVQVASRLPQNRAFSFAHDVVENTTGASFQLKKKGTTKQKDIPYNIPDQYTKNKNPQTLRFVEKNKYRINTSGEQQGLSVAKYMQQQKKRGFKL